MAPERSRGLDGNWLTPSTDELRDRCRKMGIEFCPHGNSVKMGIVAQFAALGGDPRWADTHWWTMGNTIYHPNWVADPLDFPQIIQHELVHVAQQDECPVPLWVLRYLTSQQFRWESEREAYLVDIAWGRPVQEIVVLLRSDYRITQITAQAMEGWFDAHR